MLLGDFCQSRYPKINTKPGAEVLCLENVSTENTLDNISLTLHKGEILGIFGQAGSGKSSLSKILFGIEPAKSGTIYIDRLPAKIASPQDAINLGLAYITDERSEYGLFENLDSLENVYAVKEIDADISGAVHDLNSDSSIVMLIGLIYPPGPGPFLVIYPEESSKS